MVRPRSKAGQEVQGASLGEALRILIVDDEEPIRKLLNREFKRRGLESEGAGDVPTALELLSRKDFDVVLTDIRMPGRSGVDLLRELKSADPSLEVILMTGYASVDTVVQALRLGAADYVCKPFDDLDEVCNTVVAVGRRRRSNARPIRILVVTDDLNTRTWLRRLFPERRLLLDVHTKLDTVMDALASPGKESGYHALVLDGAVAEGAELGRLLSDMCSKGIQVPLTVMLDGQEGQAFLTQTTPAGAAAAAPGAWADLATHELKLPLAAARAAVDNLNEGVAGAVSEEGRKILATISSNVDRMARLLDGVADLLDLTSGRRSLAMTPTNLNQVTEDACGAFAPVAARRGLAVEKVLPSAGPVFYGDSQKISEVLFNFLDNASRFARSRIHVSVGEEGRIPFFRVEDDGPGLPEEVLESLEDRMPLKGASSLSGRKRLGLLIAKAIVDAHGGRIGATTGGLGGAAITVQFPQKTGGAA
ncbi:MAG: response regulator [Nitrospirae bacterium]|nr:response regulator [Nitrospirota bacterium]